MSKKVQKVNEIVRMPHAKFQPPSFKPVDLYP